MTAQANFTFSTTSWPLSQQVGAAIDHLDRIWHVSPMSDTSGFVLQDYGIPLGPLFLTFRSAESMRISRASIGARTEFWIDHFLFVVLRRGSILTPSPMHRGDVGVFDLSQPLDSQWSAFEALIVAVPRKFLSKAVGELEEMHGLAVPQPLGSILSNFLTRIVQSSSVLTPQQNYLLAAAVIEMITTSIASSRKGMLQGGDHLKEIAVEKAKKYIDENIQDPDLSPAQLCRALGVSRRQLFRLFTPLGGVMTFVQARRLARAKMLLAEPDSMLSIQEMAELVGYESGARLSRSFKRYFGYIPSDLKVEAASARPDLRNGGREDDWYAWLNAGSSEEGRPPNFD